MNQSQVFRDCNNYGSILETAGTGENTDKVQFHLFPPLVLFYYLRVKRET